jgi:ectoine hydroxylase-related dioxygenase (phytanoyl-CoA dioxygenase family)
MAESLWGELARKHGIRHGDPQSWCAERPAQLGAFQKTGTFNGMATPELREVIGELIGRDRWAEPSSWGLPLVCFPQGAEAWNVPHQVWHFDLTPDPRLKGAMVGRLFVLLAPLAAQGGGTLVATGSHRIAEAIAARRSGRLSSQDMRKQLVAASPWFRDLMSPPAAGEDRIGRFMASPTVVDGVPLQVEEITGEPGDVFLMHPHALHGLSSNVRDTPRLALAQTIYPKVWYGGA